MLTSSGLKNKRSRTLRMFLISCLIGLHLELMMEAVLSPKRLQTFTALRGVGGSRGYSD